MTVRLTGGSTWCRDQGSLPAVLAIEILAQAAVIALPESGGSGGQGVLAGIDDARFERPLSAAETLVARFHVERHFGQLLKVHGSLRSAKSNESVASASLYLALTQE